MKPVIAIYSYYHLEGNEFHTNHTEIWGGYVRWLEQGGAEVVAIHHWYSYKQLDTIMSMINGILFTGVFRILNLSDIYEQKGGYLIEKAIELNRIAIEIISLFGVHASVLSYLFVILLTQKMSLA